MAQECMNIFGRKNLQVIGMIEQDMATGESATGESLKQVFADLVPLLDHPSVEIDDKLRLLILYIFYKGGLKSDSKKRIYEICNFDRWDKEVIENLEYFGKKLQKVPSFPLYFYLTHTHTRSLFYRKNWEIGKK